MIQVFTKLSLYCFGGSASVPNMQMESENYTPNVTCAVVSFPIAYQVSYMNEIHIIRLFHIFICTSALKSVHFSVQTMWVCYPKLCYPNNPSSIHNTLRTLG
ncbi:hypothetical protein L6452_21185 [Arctium lappa]|uniref:Uncharacterized protein n=1 Tax=Arctium lappa TaxID=4217 RepID=A0ACB9BCZ2_ARCLA|nr:hypothetical protein L6452_21185 [Arctium lappa]